MPLEASLFAYAGMAALAWASHQHRRIALPLLGAVRSVAARAAGALLLALSLLSSSLTLGAPQGVVAWIGALSAAGACLVLLLSRWPRAAIAAGPPVAAVAAALSF